MAKIANMLKIPTTFQSGILCFSPIPVRLVDVGGVPVERVLFARLITVLLVVDVGPLVLVEFPGALVIVNVVDVARFSVVGNELAMAEGRCVGDRMVGPWP